MCKDAPFGDWLFLAPAFRLPAKKEAVDLAEDRCFFYIVVCLKGILSMNSNPKSGCEKSLDQANNSLLDEAEALIWALIDDNIKPTDAKRLEGLLQENEQIRHRYLHCLQMHTDLHQHFDQIPAPPAPDSLPLSPVLGSLGEFQQGAVRLPPVAE